MPLVVASSTLHTCHKQATFTTKPIKTCKAYNCRDDVWLAEVFGLSLDIKSFHTEQLRLVSVSYYIIKKPYTASETRFFLHGMLVLSVSILSSFLKHRRPYLVITIMGLDVDMQKTSYGYNQRNNMAR